METNDIVELQAKKLDNVESKKDPHVMLIDDILLEKKIRDTVLVFMNDKTADIKRKCKEVSGSHTYKKEMPKNIGKPLILLAPGSIKTVAMYRKYSDFIFGSIFR